ncbi:uncharacterized protein LOC144495050 isoform X3 [Mustelus asterias]
MFRRSRLSIKPNVKPGGRGSQTAKEDDKAHTSVQQPSPERKASNEKDASESQAVLSVPPAPLPNPSIGKEERDDPDEQQENVPINKNDKNDKAGESGVNSKLSVAPLQRRKRFSTMPNLAKPRSTSVSVQPSICVTPKSPPRQQSPLNSVSNAPSIQDNATPSQTSSTDKPLPRSLEKRKPSSGQDKKLPEKKTPIPQVPQFSPVKSPVHKDTTVGTNSARAPMARKTLSSPLKERVTPSSPSAKRIVPSPSHSPARPKPAKMPSDLERLRKARKLRELLKEELKKEKKARKETVPIWETGTTPERTKMTMRDFIYYLPDTNPMLSSFEEEKRPSFPVLTKEPEVETNNSPQNEDEDEESDDAVLGPRVKVAEDGSIIIDEESLTVEVLRKKGPIVEENDPIFERGSQTTYSSFRKSTHTKPWSNKDMFFLAISMVGTDFSMIGHLFPNRTRIEIKNKFKREEKLNSWRIDKAFKEKKPLDLEFFGELLTKVLEADSKTKKEKSEKTKSQAPRKQSTTKRNRKGKEITTIESDPDDPDPVEDGDTELVEADPNAIVEANEVSCSVEGQDDAQKSETISKPSPTKRKRKKKKKVAAEPAVEETAEEPPEEESGSREPKQDVLQCKKGIQKSSTSNSGQDDGVGEHIAEGEDECHMVSGEVSTHQETSENKQPSETKRKEKCDDNKSLSDHESVAPSETTPPVTTENAKKPQQARLQKPKPNLKVTGRKRAGGKGSDQTASEALAFYDDAKEDTSDKVKESPVQEQDAPDDKSSEIMNNEVSEKEVSTAPMPETIEADKTITEEILASKAQDSDTESRSVEKPKEPRTKPGPAARSRFQKPKPNLGKAIVKKDVSTDERKMVAVQEKAITTKEVTTPSPNSPITEGSIASEAINTGSDDCSAPEAKSVDTVISDAIPIQQDAVQDPSGGANESLIPVSQSKVQSPEAVPVPSNSVELQRQSIIALDTETSRKGCWDSNKARQSERTLECDSQNENEHLKLDSIQENITSKPTRSGRQPRPTAFYKSPAEQKPSTSSTLLSEGENEDKNRSRRARSQKPKPKVSKGVNKKDMQTKTSRKGQGASKMRLVTLRASQEEDDDDDEPELVEDDDIYLINPEEVNKAPAFVPISLRSPEPVQTQVEETMEELEIAVNVSDKNYDSETEQSFPELPDNTDPSQSCTLAPEEDYHPASADQIELFVEVIEIGSEGASQEEDDQNTEANDGLQDAVYTDVSCVDQKNVEQATDLGSDPPSMQVVVCDTAPDLHTESSTLGEQSVPTEKDQKDGLDKEPSLSKEDSCNASFSSSSVTEQSDSSQTGRASRRSRFLKPKPNLRKSTPRSHAEKLCVGTQNRTMQNSVEPSGTTSQKRKHGNETEVNLDDNLHLVTVEGDEPNLIMEQVSAEQTNDMVSIPDEQDNFVGNKEQMQTGQLCERLPRPEQKDKCMGHGKQLSRTEHLDDESQHVNVQLSVPEQQDKHVEDEEQLSKAEHLDDESQHVGVQLPTPEQQDKCLGHRQQLSRTEHLDDESQHVGVQLSIPEQQDKHVEDEEQLSKAEHLDDESQHVNVQLSVPEQQDKHVEDEEQLSKAEHLDDESQHVNVQLSVPEQQDKHVEDEEQLSKAEHLDDESQHVGVQLPTPEQQDKCLGHRQQLSRTEHLDDESQHVGVQLSIPEQDKHVEDEEQLSKAEHLDDESQHVNVQLSIPEQQDKCMGHRQQLSRTEHLDDESQHVGVQLPVPEQQDKFVEDEEQLSRTKHLDAGTDHRSDRVLPEHDQPQTPNQSQETQVGFSSAACFTQSTSSPCEIADVGLSTETPEMTTEVLYVDHSQKIGVTEAQNVEQQETLNGPEENSEHMLAFGSPNEETFVLTLVEIPASSLMDYNASSTSSFPVSEDTLTVAEPALPLSTENVEVTESVSYVPACSSEPSMEATAVHTVSESAPLTESILQQRSLNKPGSCRGQMDRKRKAHSFNDNHDFPAKSPTITPINQESIEKVPPTDETTQSSLVTCTSLEEYPATAASNDLRNYGAAQMNLPSESTEGFTSTPLDDVVNPVPVETTAVVCSVSAEEMKKSGSQIRRGKLTVKPNISTKRTTCNPAINLPAKNKNTPKLSRTIPSPCVSKKSLQPELTCNLSVDMNSAQPQPGSVSHNLGQTDAQGMGTATESVHSTETLEADTDVGTTGEQSGMSTQNTASTSIRSLTRPGRKPRGFLSFISKKSSENESEIKPQRTKLLKPRMNLPRFAGKRSIPSGKDAGETTTSSSPPPAKRKSCEETDRSQPLNRGSPTDVLCNSSLQSWQSESYTEEACCAVEQDTEQMQPTRVAEYFFSDIFTEMDEDEQE